MSWTWETAGPKGHAWMVDRLEALGVRWTPPPPFPTPRKGVPALTIRQRVGLLGGWPVRPPVGRRPLPREGRILKALDFEALYAVYDEAGRLRLGLGRATPWLRSHLDTDATHYLFPDPASSDWPDPNGKRTWWQCTALIRMIDGEQVTGRVAVLPETFSTLPSTVPRHRQRRLAFMARATERDSYLWRRDHRADCGPQSCGYQPPEQS